jgi:HEAT repeat protein
LHGAQIRSFRRNGSSLRLRPGRTAHAQEPFTASLRSCRTLSMSHRHTFRRMSHPFRRMSRRLCAFAAALTVLLVIRSAKASDADFAQALAGLSQPSGDAVTIAARAIGASGDPRALAVLVALRDRNIAVSDTGHVYLRDADGALHDAAGGAPPGPQATHDPTLDNEVRRALEPMIARLELRSNDPKVRLAAVETLASRSSEEDAAALREALGREHAAEVRRALVSTLAELDLASDDPARRLGAIAAIRESGSIRFRSTLESLVATTERTASTTRGFVLRRGRLYAPSPASRCSPTGLPTSSTG